MGTSDDEPEDEELSGRASKRLRQENTHSMPQPTSPRYRRNPDPPNTYNPAGLPQPHYQMPPPMPPPPAPESLGITYTMQTGIIQAYHLTDSQQRSLAPVFKV
ncbi:hypothetical protein SISNIDRAFT_57860 [Sistotremastrum niveocremeum HHB9708]|uniref:Uncharacterized protein n=1 Tax=Sistotremastrum niveocremeum HHB9708 TaxID=1314777 RepID=A0A164VEK0_9AGAM|nr:hypothetical protein SISNIDRAFT_57860 [Sistotremastrum niveocremeum HHB9708]